MSTDEPPAESGDPIWGGTTLAHRRLVRRAALLEATLDLIGESGAAAVTMRAICRRTGLTTRYFYENFETTDELLATLYQEVSREFRAAMSAFTIAPPPLRERELATLLVDESLRDPRKSRLFLVEPYTGTVLGTETVSVMPSFAAVIQNTLLSGIVDPVRRELAAVSLASAVAGMFAAWFNGSLRAGREQVIDHLATAISAHLTLYDPRPAGPGHTIDGTCPQF